MSYHILFSRINPSLKIDLIRICTIEHGQAKALTADEFADLVAIPQFVDLKEYFLTSSISDSKYIYHEDISKLLDYLMNRASVSIDFFDNNLVIVFDYGTEEETPQEK